MTGGARTLTLPQGTKYEINLPPFSLLPNLDQAAKDVGTLIVAAFSTSMFPEAKSKQLYLINRALSQWRYQPKMVMNRAQRRRSKKNR